MNETDPHLQPDVAGSITVLAILAALTPVVLMVTPFLLVALIGGALPENPVGILFLSAALGALLGQISLFAIWIAMGSNDRAEKMSACYHTCLCGSYSQDLSVRLLLLYWSSHPCIAFSEPTELA
jgi:hypothetical protein